MPPDVTSSDRSFDEILLIEIGRVIEPLSEAFEEEMGGLLRLADDFGISQELLDTELEMLAATLEASVSPPVEALESAILDPLSREETPEISDVPELISAVGETAKGIRQLKQLQFQEVDASRIAERLVDSLLIQYLETYHPRASVFLNLFGVIREDPLSNGGELDLSKLASLPNDPGTIPREAFGWGTEDFAPFLVCYYLHELAWSIGIPASLDPPEHRFDDVMGLNGYAIDFSDPMAFFPEEELRIPVVSLERDGSIVEAGVRIVPLPGEDPKLPGLAVVPFGLLTGSESFELGDGWTFNVHISGDVDDWGLLARPNETPAVSSLPGTEDTQSSSTDIGKLHGTADITYDGSGNEDGETTLLGTPRRSRLAVRTVSAETRVDYEGGELTFVVSMPSTGIVGVHPSDFDGFLAQVMPADGLAYDFDVNVGWSSKTGLFFERGGTLEVSLPQNQRIGPALLEEIYLSIGTPDADSAAQPNASPAAMHIVGAASASIELGPIVGTIKRMGVSADVSFPENADGNLGPIDLDMGFEPPDGIGLVVDAGGVTGGGYLEFDHENERYAGTLQLHIGDLVLSAVGLLTTRLPDGSSGFSLLVIISGEFTPVQLGLGFTLNGVGGLLGINRSFRAEPLGEAVREGSLDSVLFPVDPVANAQRIISDLRAIFPPTRDVHVFGPMAKLGYGTPAMVTADLAVLLEIPTFKLAVLGRLRARLPDEEAPLVILNMDVVGVLDPPGQRASIDASLVDSRIGPYTVSGDMAMRTSWGENPRFVLSVGGFHPRFKPPGDFPALRRVRVGIGEPGGNPSIDLNGYLALTSNTAQVGAGASFRAKAGPAKVEGKLAFDALFEFDPFRFVIDFLVHVSVRVYGKGLSVRVDGTLSGTSPWRVKGRVSIDLWLIEVNASISLTLGEKETHTPLPAARVMPLLAESVSNPSNWAAQLPPRGRTSVTLREVKATPDEVLVHPLGRLSVRQTVVPLEYRIETFRRATPGDFTRFSIMGVSIEGTGGGLELGESTTEQFAPAQFLNLTDDQKLDSPAFESLEAGRQMSTDGLGAVVSGGSQRALLTYETTVVDREEVVYGRRLRNLGTGGTMLVGQTWAMTAALAERSAVATAQTQAVGPGRTAPVVEVASGTERDEPTHRIDARTGALTGRIRLNEETYAIADARTMEPVDPASMQPVALDVAERNTMPKSEAKRTLSRYEAAHPGDAGLYRVVAMHRLRSAAAARSA